MSNVVTDDGRSSLLSVAFNSARPEDVHAERLTSPFAHISRLLRETVIDFAAAAALDPGSRVLDFGCATKPYNHLFPGVTLIGADIAGNPIAECAIGADGRVDMADSSVDAVLSTQVLEHVASPSVYLEEAFRVLRPGRHLLLTTHGLMYLHRDPTDYWRWTCDGLAKIVSDTGFEVLEIRGLMGLVPTALQFVQDGTCSRLPRRLWKPYIYIFQRSIAWFDKQYSPASLRDNSLVLGVLARRPGERSAG